jgi:two-component system phosphate regulon sensor histidine kinase PhoR
MRFGKPANTALFIAALVGVVFLVALFWLRFINLLSINTWLIALSTIAFSLFVYAISVYSINQFVYNKVKLIFKTIHDIKTGTDLEEEEIARSTSLEMVEREVAEWAEERREEMTELKSREKFRREFIGNVSHELKTPIFNIQGYILTLIDGGLEDENINLKYLKRASKSVDRMINLIQDMDTLNKLESGILEVKKKKFDVARLIAEVIDILEDSAKKRDVKIKTSFKKNEVVMVLADPNRIEQVLFNLIINAIKYGKPKGTVSISHFNLDNRTLIEVSDDGMGIPESDVQRIFERFYRVDKSRTRDAGGSGLGLSIVKHIIDTHKETISVRSTVGVGSTFSFTLKNAE